MLIPYTVFQYFITEVQKYQDSVHPYAHLFFHISLDKAHDFQILLIRHPRSILRYNLYSDNSSMQAVKIQDIVLITTYVWRECTNLVAYWL